MVCLAIAAIVAVYFVSVAFIQPTNSCYGPEITADIDKTAININDTVTVIGHAGPPADNLTVRVDFTDPITATSNRLLQLIQRQEISRSHRNLTWSAFGIYLL